MVPANEIKMVYISDWYDAPLSGHCWYKDKYCYFHLNTIEKDGNRLFDLYELVGENLINELANRQMWTDLMDNSFIKDVAKAVVDLDPTECHNIWMTKYDHMFPDLHVDSLKSFDQFYLWDEVK